MLTTGTPGLDFLVTFWLPKAQKVTNFSVTFSFCVKTTYKNNKKWGKLPVKNW